MEEIVSAAEANRNFSRRLRGVRGHLIHDNGAYTPQGTNLPYNASTALPGPYILPAYKIDVSVVETNKVATMPVRGAGYPEGAFAMERVLDAVAAETGIDRAEIRRRNLLADDVFPFQTLTGVTYDSGAYRTTYKLRQGPNPEHSTVTTRSWSARFTDRWTFDELRLRTKGASKADILDRATAQFGPTTCGRSEKTFNSAEGAFVANINGPVRAIRAYIGANSGPLTERDHVMYDQRQEVRTFLRVHAIPGVMDLLDYSPAAAGMTYRAARNPAAARATRSRYSAKVISCQSSPSFQRSAPASPRAATVSRKARGMVWPAMRSRMAQRSSTGVRLQPSNASLAAAQAACAWSTEALGATPTTCSVAGLITS